MPYGAPTFLDATDPDLTPVPMVPRPLGRLTVASSMPVREAAQVRFMRVELLQVSHASPESQSDPQLWSGQPPTGYRTPPPMVR